MDKDTLREWRCFTLTDYEQEEAYLRQRHREGWRFVKVTLPGQYYFERCQPEDVVYKLDFRPLRGENKEAFVTIYRDYGWEYMQDLNDYSYFRKSARDTQQADLDIFSDDESRLSMLRRIFTARMLPILVLMISVCVCCRSLIMSRDFAGTWEVILAVLCGVVFLFYIYCLVHCGIGFYRLWKKYSGKK